MVMNIKENQHATGWRADERFCYVSAAFSFNGWQPDSLRKR